METPVVEKAFQDFLIAQFGEEWVTELPDDTLSHMMTAFFSGCVTGMVFRQKGGKSYFDAVHDLARYTADLPKTGVAQ